MAIYTKTAAGWEEIGTTASVECPEPELPGGSAWGDFTTNGDEQDSGTWGPDAQGRMWKWAEWNEAKDYTVNLTGGLYWVLTVGGGSTGKSIYDGNTRQGRPGYVNEGYWEFPANAATPIKVGAAGAGSNFQGGVSSIGDYGVQGKSSWGDTVKGTGATDNSSKGYISNITGYGAEYGPGDAGGTRPGRAGRLDGSGYAGCVIIATVDEEKTDYYPPGALPGVGGWATITDVKGKGKKYAYGDWVAYEFTSDGSLDTQAGGLVDALIVGAGGVGTSDRPRGGGGGGVVRSLTKVETSVDLTVGKASGSVSNSHGTAGGKSTFADLFAGGGSGSGGRSGHGGGGGIGGDADQAGGGAGGSRTSTTNGGPGITHDITGVDVEYGCGGNTTGTTKPGYGSGSTGTVSQTARHGVVIVRVPKTNDLFKDVAGSEAGEPFDIPTTRQAVVASLEEKVEEAVRDRRKRR